MPLFVSKFLSRITMYRLAVFVLASYIVVAASLSFFGLLFFSASDIISQTLFLLLVCHLTNAVFSKLFGAVSNRDSTTITALILALIVGPTNFSGQVVFLALVGFAAIASKYLLAIRKRHIFNPAAFGVTLLALSGKFGASWWIGSYPLLPFVVLGGFLVLAKIKRFTLAAVYLTVYAGLSLLSGANATNLAFFGPVIFFATIMLIEPLTSPVETKKQIAYSVLTASAFAFFQEFAKISYGLEFSLLIGNVFFYLVSSPLRASLSLRKKEKIAVNTYAFHFAKGEPFTFIPGQFMYWTLPHKNPDTRGIRRYFTISSSPTEKEIVIAARIPDTLPSSFKRTLKKLKRGGEIIAVDAAGEFTLPKDPAKSVAFIAGGIGITPFASMAKWMLDKNEKRDIVLLYANSKKEDIAFGKLFKEAEGVGIKTHFALTQKDGHIDEKMIAKKVPDYKNRIFYISGPQVMVEKLSNLISKMGVKKVKTDFFPGYSEVD